MEMSCKNLIQENQNVGIEIVSDEEILSPTSAVLHLLELPDSILLHIFSYLPFSSVGAVSQVCKRWNVISYDELLWRSVFLQHYKLSSKTCMPTKARSWRSEFKRLYYHTPAVLSEERKEHKDEVLHISFSHDGTMFATCSKDGYFKIWECTSPVRLLFKMDMKSSFSWKFTQFSQFNESDTCLLVSGVYFGRLSTSGEIAVFNLQDEFRMQCRVTNKPYDVFGAWYDNDHLLSGTLYWTGDFNSVSAVWLSKASQEVESEVESVSMVLYRFENVNSSSIRLLHVAEVDRDEDAAGSCLDKDDLELSEGAMASTRSSSLGPDEDRRVDQGSEVRRSRSGVADKCQGQEESKREEVSVLDQFLRKCIAEDEFDIENEDKTDDEEEDLETEDDGQGEWDGHQQSYHKEKVRSDNENTVHMSGNASSNPSNKRSLRPVDSQNLDKGLIPPTPASQQPCFYMEPSVSSLKVDGTESHIHIDGVSDYGNSQPSQPSSHSQNANTQKATHIQPVINFDSSVQENSGPVELGLKDDDLVANGISQSLPAEGTNEVELSDCYIDRQRGQRCQSSYENVSYLRNISPQRNSGAVPYQANCDDFSIVSDLEQNRSLVGDSNLISSNNSNADDGMKETTMDYSEGWETGATGECCSLSGQAVGSSDLAVGSNPAQQHQDPGSVSSPWSFPLPPEDPDFSDIVVEDDNNNTDVSINSNNNSAYNVDFYNTEPRFLDVDPASRNLNVPQPPKTSIATQTELATSRASSLHSLSHMSHSSSLSRDISLKAPREKLLIYTWGSETYIPHKIGIKRMRWTDFSKGEVTARRSSMLLPDVMENLHNMAGNRRDKPDVTIEMHGHIVGLSLSPDHKHLYVNCRPWPKNYIISDPQESPPLAQEVEISTIDLTTFAFVGPVLRSHKAYTHSDECFFLNLDVGDDYVASGAEDRQGYLWDRHYGIPLYRFPHHNVVNCVAINPQDPEMLVTVSDDYTFKVWMSRSKAKEQKTSTCQL